MMNNIEINDLIAVLEDIRARDYANIPSELIRSIVSEQLENQDDRAEARKKTKKLVDDFLKEACI